jgi:hypothetical protein
VQGERAQEYVNISRPIDAAMRQIGQIPQASKALVVSLRPRGFMDRFINVGRWGRKRSFNIIGTAAR